MSIDQKTITGTRAASARPPNELLSVFTWELRRLAASPLSWAGAAGTFVFFLFFIWLKHAWSLDLSPDAHQFVPMLGTSAFGLLFEFIYVLMLLYGLFVPFIAADAVARDYKQRMHEVLMSTALSRPAYVWGRFLAALAVSGVLAVLMLAAVGVMSEYFYQQLPGYPAPELGAMLSVWTVVVLPATILLAAVSFALGTLWPRLTTAVQLASLIAWIMLFVFGLGLAQFIDNFLNYFNPTGNGILAVLIPEFAQAVHAASGSDLASSALRQQATLPSLLPWLLPHYALAACGIAMVGMAAARFQKFREVLN